MKKFLAICTLASASAMAAPTLINGAGATFPFPLYSKWFSEYAKVKPGVQVNYNSIGSGGGIRQLLDNTVHFGASDAPMTSEEESKSTVKVLHVPTVMGSVVVTYNLPGVTKALRLSPDTVAGIFLGKIAKWDDAKIAAENPGVALPKTAILVATRSDGSGTTAIFTDYLAKVSPEWKSKVGAGKSVKWPVGLSGKGNEGVTGLVKQTPGAVGYVELIYALSNKLPVAEIKNVAGNYVMPSIESTTAAAQGVQIPEDFKVSITNASGKKAYSIAAFTYLLVYEKMKDPAVTAELVALMKWALTDGQKFAKDLGYAPLPAALAKRALGAVAKVKAEASANVAR